MHQQSRETVLLDVVVATKMPSIHLEGFLQSLLSLPEQVRVNIVLDDLSGTVIDLNTVPKSNAKVRFWPASFGSPGQARNFGLDKSESEYIMFWDVDDYPILSYLSQAIRYMNLTFADIGIGNWSSESKSLEIRDLDNTPLPVSRNPGLWRFIFRRQIIGDTRFCEWRWGEDQLFLAKMFEKLPRVVPLPFHLYDYRENVQGSLTSDRHHVVDLFAVFREMSFLYGDTSAICRIVINNMFLRQYLTLLRHGNFRIRVRSTFVLASTLIREKKLFPLDNLRKLKGVNW